MKKTKGFTLVELLLTAFLFAMVMAMVGTVFQRGQAQAELNDGKMVLQGTLRETLYRMGQEIRETSPSRVSVTNAGATLTFQIPASVNNSGVITWSGPITYQLGGNGTQLIRTNAAGQTSVLANNVQGIIFTATGAPIATVNYTVTTRRTLPNGRILTLTSTGEARFRNP